MKSSTKYLKIILNYILLAVTLLLCLYVIPKLIVFFMPFFVAWILSMMVNPLVKFLDKKLKIKRKAGSVVVIVITLAVVILVCYWIVYLIVSQISGFMSNVPKIWAVVSSAINQFTNEVNRLFTRMPMSFKLRYDDFGDSISKTATEWMGNLGESAAQYASDSVKNLPLTIVGIVMGVLASYSFVAERDNVSLFMAKVLPREVKERWNLVTSTMRNAVGGYFKAQFKIMAVVYVVLFVGLMILRIDYSFLLALLIAVLDFLPFFGTGTIMWPWAVIVLVQKDYKLAIGIMVVWGASQLVRQLIQPKVLGDTVGMPAIPTLFLLYIGFRLGGAIGLIISVPVGMIIYNLFKAGVFSNFIYSTRILMRDLKRFRVFSKEELEAEGIEVSETGIGTVVSDEESNNA